MAEHGFCFLAQLMASRPSLPPYPPLKQAQHQAIRALHKKQEREARQEFFIEGIKLCREAVAASMDVRYVVVSNFADKRVLAVAQELHAAGVDIYATRADKFDQLCDASTPQQILAVVGYPNHNLVPREPIVMLDGVADPGNLGTIIRTADWFGFRNIIVGAGSVDRFNPKVLRATMGSVFRCAVVSRPSLARAIVEEFSEYQFFGTALDGILRLPELTKQTLSARPWGIVLGSESHGISAETAAHLTGLVRIAGANSAESLNVAVAGGIILHHCFNELAV